MCQRDFGRKGLTIWQKMQFYLHMSYFCCIFAAAKIYLYEKIILCYYGSNDFAERELRKQW